MPQTKRDAVPNITLYNLREARAETQEQTAAALNALAANGARRPRSQGTISADGNAVSFIPLVSLSTPRRTLRRHGLGAWPYPTTRPCHTPCRTYKYARRSAEY